MRTLVSTVTAAVVLLTMLLAVACSDDNGTVDPVDPKVEAQRMANRASSDLADLMMSVIDTVLAEADSSLRPRDVDFTGVYATYSRALELDEDCQDARFGVAFTGLMLILADDDFNDLIDKLKQVYDTLQFNPLRPQSATPRIVLGNSMFVSGVPLSVGGLDNLIPSPLAIDQITTSLAAVEPSISQLQASLESALLPRVQESRQHLAYLVSDPDYTFVISPQMQGNDGASQIVLDRSDFQLFLAMADALEAGLRVFFARNLNLDTYSASGIEDALRKDSDFLSLRDNGVGIQHMNAAKDRVLSCLENIKETVALLEAEIGSPQADDLIKVDERDLTDLHAIRDTATSLLQYFDGPRQLDVVWVKDTISLTVDISRFFDSPIGNFKDFLPDYTVSIEAADDLHKLVVCYEWTAATFDDWEFPNATMNGLLPEMTSQEIKDIWFYDLDIRWNRSECDTLWISPSW